MQRVGSSFGRWTVLSESSERVRAGRAYVCRCTCGTEKVVPWTFLQSGSSRSCGCLRLELSAARQTKHGMFGTPEYTAWSAMWYRCTNKKCKAYKNYGGRGITVCRRWKKFENFFADVGPRPSDAHQLDRVRNDKGYAPNNTQWSLPVDNIRNRRNTKWAVYQGDTVTLAQIAEASGIAYATLQARYNRGDRGDRLCRPITKVAKCQT